MDLRRDPTLVTSRSTKHPKHTQQSWLLQHSHSVTKHFQTLHQGRLYCGTLRNSHWWKQHPFLFPCDFSALWCENKSKSAAFTGELEPQWQRSHSCLEHKSPQYRWWTQGFWFSNKTHVGTRAHKRVPQNSCCKHTGLQTNIFPITSFYVLH